MKTSLIHRNGGTITALYSIGHATRDGVAEWFFVGDVTWQDGGTSKAIEISPICVCCDNAVAEQMKDYSFVNDRLSQYLGKYGKWHDMKEAKDGRCYSWTPHAKTDYIPIVVGEDVVVPLAQGGYEFGSHKKRKARAA